MSCIDSIESENENGWTSLESPNGKLWLVGIGPIDIGLDAPFIGSFVVGLFQNRSVRNGISFNPQQ